RVLEVGLAENSHDRRPAGHAESVLRWHAPLLAIRIAELKGVGAVLVDDHNHVEAAAARPESSGSEHRGPRQQQSLKESHSQKIHQVPCRVKRSDHKRSDRGYPPAAETPDAGHGFLDVIHAGGVGAADKALAAG